VEASNSCVGTLIFGSFFFIVFCQSFFSFFSAPFSFFCLVFLSSFIFPLLFRHCFIPVSLSHVVSYLAYPNLLGTKRLGCCCCVVEIKPLNHLILSDEVMDLELKLSPKHAI
jgi:hypothetical protein